VLRGRWLAACEAGLSSRHRLQVHWAFVVASDEPPNTGCLGWLVEVERLNELIALVLGPDRREHPQMSFHL